MKIEAESNRTDETEDEPKVEQAKEVSGSHLETKDTSSRMVQSTQVYSPKTKDKKRVLLITLIPGVKTLRESYRKGKEMLRKKSRNLLFM